MVPAWRQTKFVIHVNPYRRAKTSTWTLKRPKRTGRVARVSAGKIDSGAG